MCPPPAGRRLYRASSSICTVTEKVKLGQRSKVKGPRSTKVKGQRRSKTSVRSTSCEAVEPVSRRAFVDPPLRTATSQPQRLSTAGTHHHYQRIDSCLATRHITSHSCTRTYSVFEEKYARLLTSTLFRNNCEVSRSNRLLPGHITRTITSRNREHRAGAITSRNRRPTRQ